MRQTSFYGRGFAIATAMCMIAIVAVAMTAVCALLAADVRRTLNGAADAQLRQLLIAAEVDAPAHLSDSGQREWTTPVPGTLADARVVSSRVGEPGKVQVMAAMGDRVMSEDLCFESENGVWRLSSTEVFAGVGR